ncbi:MAG: hypothetical protein NVV59_05840 [Chitinophagaceae bacterium]|nr:hypothetical protein [Chitinophagaceae bacterium]
MKYLILSGLLLCIGTLQAQELYVYTEPASNVPAKSISAKLTGMYIPNQRPYYRNMQRVMPSVSVGLSAKWMLTAGTTFSDMHTNNLRWESAWLYAKYRFLSNDEMHSHFRMAAFADVAYTRSPFHFDEVNLLGDKDGVQFGIIGTQLWHKFALSGTVSHTQVLHSSRNDDAVYVPSRIYQVMNYSLSAGYLLLPRQYTSYKQTNLNLYAEMLAQQSLDKKAYFVDIAPAVQLIFNSNTKLNLGYRFQLGGDMQRMANRQWQITLDRTFLNAIKK